MAARSARGPEDDHVHEFCTVSGKRTGKPPLTAIQDRRRQLRKVLRMSVGSVALRATCSSLLLSCRSPGLKRACTSRGRRASHHGELLKRTIAVPKTFACPVLKSNVRRAGKNRPELPDCGQSLMMSTYLPVPFQMQTSP
jgi:hypothetical protein